MRESDIEFHITITGTKETNGQCGKTYFNFDENRVEIDIFTGVGSEFKDSDEARGLHELEHGRQFMDGELGFVEDKKGNSGGGDAYNQSDEKNAFNTQNIIGAAEGKPVDAKKEVQEHYGNRRPETTNIHSDPRASEARRKVMRSQGGNYMSKYLYKPTRKQIRQKRKRNEK